MAREGISISFSDHDNEECSLDVIVVHALKLHLVGHDHNMIC
jgi:ssRNA-specific RNase YbeY (16S rRNA maturation enzyme)